jgi:hypothetical protein
VGEEGAFEVGSPITAKSIAGGLSQDVEFRPFAGDLFIGGEHPINVPDLLTVGSQQAQGFTPSPPAGLWHRRRRRPDVVTLGEREGIAGPSRCPPERCQGGC